MKFDILEKDGFLELIRLSISKTELQSGIAAWFSQRQPAISLPGFRKGKAPIGLIQKKYHETASNDTLDELIKKGLTKIHTEHYQSKPLLESPILAKKNQTNTDFIFDIEFALAPDVTVQSLKEISAFPMYELDMSDDEFLSYIEEKFSKKISLPNVRDGEGHVISDKSIVYFYVDIFKSDGHPIHIDKEFQKNFNFVKQTEHEFLPLDVFLSLKGLKDGDVYETTLTLDDKMKQFLNLPDGDIIIKITIESAFPVVESSSLDEYISYMKADRDKFLDNEKRSIIDKHQNYIFFLIKKEIFDYLDTFFVDIPKKIAKSEYLTLKNTFETVKTQEQLSNDSNSLIEDEELEKLAQRRVKLGVIVKKILSDLQVLVSVEDVSNFYAKKENITKGLQALMRFNFDINAYTQDLNERNFVSYVVKNCLNNPEPQKISMTDLRKKLKNTMGLEALEDIDSFPYI
jgi:trigger factor